MAFFGPNDILVEEKDTGMVRRIVDRTELPQPLVARKVATYGHRLRSPQVGALALC